MRNIFKLKNAFTYGTIGVLLVVLIVVLILCFPEMTKQDSLTGDGSTVTQNGTEQDSSKEDTDTEDSTDTEDATNVEDTTTENDTESNKNTETILGNGEFVNPEFAGLSNQSEGWGPGGDRNELGQYMCCFSYNKKYRPYDAYFMVEDSNYIYLTMDEGYENGYTPAILDTLKEKNVKIVFFVTSQFVKSNPELVQRMIDEGHTVGNHSTTHPSKGMPSLTIDAQKNDIMGLHNLIKDTYGYEMSLFRNPAGIFSEQSLAVTKSLGYKSVFWSFAYYDYDPADQPEPTAALNKMMDKLHPGAIYLLHAVSATNTQVLGDFIDQARQAGYEFAVLK